MQAFESDLRKELPTRWTFNTFLIVAGFFVLILALLVAGGFSPAVFAFAGYFLIPSVALTGLHVWRPRSWTYLAAGIANSYLFVLYLPFIVTGFGNPADWTGYIAGFLVIPVLTWNLSAGILGLLQTRKGRPQLDLKLGFRSAHGLFVLATAAVCLGAGVTSAIAYGRAASNPSSGGFDFAAEAWSNLTAENFAFHPMQFSVKVNTITQITVTNKDSTRHTFTYTLDGTTYSHEILPSTTTSFLVLFHSPASIPFWCIPHQAMGMTGTMTVS